MAIQFTGFQQNDFKAFNLSKREDAQFNEERKAVWEKMKKFQSLLDLELKKQQFPLRGKISQYWINYTKRHVNGIWLAYTDITPYYKVCQLNCGIYKDGFFVGIEINPKAHEHLQNLYQYVSQNRNEFISTVSKLDQQYLQISCGECTINSPKISSDLGDLLKGLQKEEHWFDLGEWYNRQEIFLRSSEVISRIPKIFETLFPLYLVCAGRRPTGSSVKEKLLRINDTKKHDALKTEKEITNEINTLTSSQINDLIKDIDQRNRLETPQRLGRNSKTYRRNPVLSTVLKKKFLDKCQICGLNLGVTRGFFCDTHHLKPLREGGLDISENILVVCPNHHRFLDRSRYELLSKDKSIIVIKINEEIVKIPLSNPK